MLLLFLPCEFVLLVLEQAEQKTKEVQRVKRMEPERVMKKEVQTGKN